MHGVKWHRNVVKREM